jgi:threonine synthase
MGLPVKGFRIATNQNDILYRLFTTGKYEMHSVHPSSAPSMDIQIASNFERFLYFHEGRNSGKVREIMSTFRSTGHYTFENFNRDIFSASRATDEDIRAQIKDIHKRFGYIPDPHTACGFQDLPGGGTRIILGTAHPAKFPDTIEAAIGEHPTSPRLEELKSIEPRSYELEPDPESVKKFIQEHLTS